MKLDARSFEELLAAAYTVQEHNARQKMLAGMQAVCTRCGGALRPEDQHCTLCGAAREEFRPGERLQQKWASLWLMSQQQGRRPERPSDDEETSATRREPEAGTVPWPAQLPESVPEPVSTSLTHEDVHQRELTQLIREAAGLPAEVLPSESPAAAGEVGERQNQSGWNLRVLLRFYRSDLYLGLAILVLVVTLAWALSAAPVGRSGQRRAPLTLWERALVTLGVADAPDAPVYRGNPKVQVWADPHTALYYCAGEEQFGKTTGGHFSSQRDAQMDQFSPAAGAACE